MLLFICFASLSLPLARLPILLICRTKRRLENGSELKFETVFSTTSISHFISRLLKNDRDHFFLFYSPLISRLPCPVRKINKWNGNANTIYFGSISVIGNQRQKHCTSNRNCVCGESVERIGSSTEFNSMKN